MNKKGREKSRPFFNLILNLYRLFGFSYSQAGIEEPLVASSMISLTSSVW